MSDLENLNPEQKQAVLENNSHLKIIAGPGSGKTRVIVAKINYLVATLKIDPTRICAVTFTNKAANEMKVRLRTQYHHRIFDWQISTYHSLCRRIIEAEGGWDSYQKNFHIMDDNDRANALFKVMVDNHLFSGGLYESKASQRKAARDVGVKISRFKRKWGANTTASQEEVMDDAQAMEIYRYYEKYKAANNFLDFDDLLLHCILLLQKPEIQKRWQNKFDYILIDEFQDINDIQFRIIHKLVGKQTKLTAVGDPNQTIYEWRGANQRFFINFKKYFPTALEVNLNKNYRSTPEIMHLANALVKNEGLQSQLKMETINQTGTKPLLCVFNSADEQADYIAQEIKRLRTEHHFKNSDFKILYRNNWSSQKIETGLEKNKIPFLIVGDYVFWRRTEIILMINLLKIINEQVDVDWDRILHFIQGIGDKGVARIKQAQAFSELSLVAFLRIKEPPLDKGLIKLLQPLISFCQALPKLRQLQLAPMLTQALHLLKWDNQQAAKPYFDKLHWGNIQQLIWILEEYQNHFPELTTAEMLAVCLNEWALEKPDTVVKQNCVEVMTIHKAKGTEAKVVFLIDTMDHIFRDRDAQVLYVALTRAQEFLFITTHTGWVPQLNQPGRLSSFITPLFDYVDEKKVDLVDVHDKPRASKVQYMVEQRVEHSFYGLGSVIKVDKGYMRILFDDQMFGERILQTNDAALTLVKQ